eukprot:PITA_06380
MNLSLSPEKCEFLMTEGTVLGHTISQQGLQVDPNNIVIIQRVPPRQKVRDVRSFLGLVGYYRRFIEDFSKIASPLFGLLGKDVEFMWTQNCQEALDVLKSKLVTSPILRGPNWALLFHIHMDASNKSIGAALGQVEEKLPYDIYFVSKNLSKAELNYTITEKELLAVAHFLNNSRHTYPQKRRARSTGEEGVVDDQIPDENLFSISVLSPCFVDISNYLVSAQFPPHLSSKGKSKIMRKSAPFTWIGGNLFKLGLDQILRHCVREEEVFDILLTSHDGPCGVQFATKRTTFIILQAGYYWPTLHQDARRYISQCDRCQRMGKPTPRDEMPLQPQVTFKPFEKWAMDCVGPINPPSNQKSYIIVCMDYLIKWAETKAIKAAIEEKVAKFLRENIFYKFGYPRELVIDQGSHFTSNLIEDLLAHHRIRHKTSTPYHPQENGQVEVNKRALEDILTKVVSSSRKYWTDRLVDAT